MSLLPLDMTDPVATGAVGDRLLEKDMEDNEVVTSLPDMVSYLAGASSSDEDEAPGNPIGGVPTRVPTEVPSGGLILVCGGTMAAHVSVQARVAGPLPSPAAREVCWRRGWRLVIAVAKAPLNTSTQVGRYIGVAFL